MLPWDYNNDVNEVNTVEAFISEEDKPNACHSCPLHRKCSNDVNQGIIHK